MNQDVARTWDAEAPTYDDAPDHGMRDPAVRAAWRALLSNTLGESPLDVLEPGCGTGTVALLLAELGHQVRGVDLSPGMLERARAKTDASGLQVELALGDAQDPDGVASSYDVVICRHVLWAVSDPEQALRRWCALVRRPGRLVLVEGFWSTGAGLHAEQVLDLLDRLDLHGDVRPLTDPALWGQAIDDERYLVTVDVGPESGPPA